MQLIKVGSTEYQFPDGMEDDAIRAAIKADMSGGHGPGSDRGLTGSGLGPGRNVIADRYGQGPGTAGLGVQDRPWQEGLVDGMADGAYGALRLAEPVVAAVWDRVFGMADTMADDELTPLQGYGDTALNPVLEARESAIQQERGAAGGTIEPSRIIGNMISPANLLPAKAATAVAGTGRGVIRNFLGGTVGGAVGGSMSPTGDISKNTMIGAAVGGPLGAVTGAGSRILSPKTDPNVRMLVEKGVHPTLGKHFGKSGAGLEDITIGNAPGPNFLRAKRMDESLTEFNRAVYDEVLKPIGAKADKSWAVGSESVAKIHHIINKAYDKAFAGVKGTMDDELMGDLLKIGMAAKKELSDSNADEVRRIIKNKIVAELRSGEPVSGARLQAIPRTIRDISVKLNKGDFNQGQVAEFVDEAGSAINRMLARNNPPKALEALRAVDKAYPRFKALSRANPAAEAEQGFTPNQLLTALSITDKSKDKVRFHEGGMPMQRLAQAGKSVLPNIVPDSGTPVRSAMNQITGVAPIAGGGLSGAGMMIDPVMTGSILGAMSIPYLANVPKALSKAMVNRPGFVDPLARGLSVSGLMAAPGAGAGAVGFNK